MPENMSKERIDLLKGYGAEVVLTPAKDYMVGSNKKAEELAETLPGAFLVGPGFNPNNPAMHIKTTGPEIWRDLDGKADIFVAAIGISAGAILWAAIRVAKRPENEGKNIVFVFPDKGERYLSSGLYE